jgi:hypothetical protein
MSDTPRTDNFIRQWNGIDGWMEHTRELERELNEANLQIKNLKAERRKSIEIDDAEALRIDLQAIRMVCEAEGMTVTIGDKSLENYRRKYSRS